MSNSIDKSYKEFIAKIRTAGVLTTNKFSVLLPSDIPDENGNAIPTGDLNMMCDATSLPGTNIMTSDVRMFGENLEMPYGINYPPIDLSFIATGDFDIRRYFDSWNNLIFDRGSRTLGYYKSYAKDLQLTVSNKNGDTVYSIILHEAYPKNVLNMNLQYQGTEVAKVNVSIVYKWWERNDYVGGLVLDIPGLATGNGTSIDLQSPVGLDAIGTYTDRVGRMIAQDGPQAAARIVASLGSSPFGIAGVPGFSTILSGLSGSLGSSLGGLGGGLSSLSQNLTAVIGPVATIGTAIAGVSQTLSSINNLLVSVGIRTDMGALAGRVGSFGGVISQATQINGIPGALQGVGSSFGSLQGSFGNAVTALSTLPNVTSSAVSSLSNMGSLFGTSGNNISSVATGLFNLG